MENSPKWYDEYEDESQYDSVDEYDITASPNDFNIMTIHSFIESGVVKIPGFQRNYVWDIKRASKLVESIILGLPIPQLFLYEEDKNKFVVIDGQQRLMSIYYFIKKRFPKKEVRGELRKTFNEKGIITDDLLFDNKYFQDFNLDLPHNLSQGKNKINGLNYATLGEHQFQFNLRPLRNIIIKQNDPNDNSAIYEIFNRLNSGGVNLTPQEIRASLFHSNFYDMLFSLNLDKNWRRLLRIPQPDLHMVDMEIILRAFAMLMNGENYSPSLIKFLNDYSRKCKYFPENDITYLKNLFLEFLNSTIDLPDNIFFSNRTKKFSTLLFESTFAASLKGCLDSKTLPQKKLAEIEIRNLDADSDFQSASIEGTTKTVNVQSRLKIAHKFISTLC